MKNPASGGGRWVEVSPERLLSWIDNFARRHGGEGAVTYSDDNAAVTFAAADRATAQCYPPFPPLPAVPADAGAQAAARTIVAHAQADRVVGVLLVRLGGYAVGVFAGSPPVLAASKAGSRPVHGRSAAGGWSQHRFARRREKQVSEALAAAAQAAVTVLTTAKHLDAIVLGGDKRATEGMKDDPRLASFLDRAESRFLTVPDPRLSVLKGIPSAYLAI